MNFKKFWFFYLNTIGAGTQNLMRIFLMLSCRVLSSRYHEVWSLAEAPAVGSGAPRTMLMGDGCGDSSMSSKRCAVGRICCGSSLIKYCANFCNCSRCKRDNDSLTGARRHTCCGWKSLEEKLELKLSNGTVRRMGKNKRNKGESRGAGCTCDARTKVEQCLELLCFRHKAP